MTATQMGRKSLADMRGIVTHWKKELYAMMLHATQSVQTFSQLIPGISSSPLTLLTLLAFIIMGLVRFVIWKWSPVGRSRSADPVVAAYERMLRILKKQGLTKKPQWTAFEFVQFVEEQAKHIAPIVKDITQTYCRARFGQPQWSKDYSDKMQYQLAMLKPT
jgi:hypothetical protein